jgi:hypothetical protein
VFGGTVGGPSGLYQTISGVQSVFFTSPTSSHNERMTSALYISTFGKASSDAGHNWVTHNCCAMYFNPPTYYNTAQETTWANAYIGSNDTTGIAPYVDDVANVVTTFPNLKSVKAIYTNTGSWSAGYQTKDGNNLKLNGYEGGWSPDYGSSGTTNVDKFRAATKGYVKLYDYMKQTYTDFVNAGGEFPTCFQMGGPVIGSGGAKPSAYAWSVLEDIYQTPEPPQWTAIRLFNNNKRRLLIKT